MRSSPGFAPSGSVSSINIFSPEEIEELGFPPAFPEICPSPVGPAVFPLDSGNIVVEDESSPGVAFEP